MAAQSLPQVRFVAIPGFPGYAAGDDGSVWSLVGSNGREWRKMNPVEKPNGYLHVQLRGPDGVAGWYVHRLILTVFVGPEGVTVDARHQNGDRQDNRLTNLAWGTRQENCRDAIRHGTWARGEMMPNAKLSTEKVLLARKLRASGMTFREIGERLGVTDGCARDAALGIKWKHVEGELTDENAEEIVG